MEITFSPLEKYMGDKEFTVFVNGEEVALVKKPEDGCVYYTCGETSSGKKSPYFGDQDFASTLRETQRMCRKQILSQGD